jgi:methylated-DNA-[protein]-cysteine S-methyltransferase
LRWVSRIPVGRIATYGDLARLAGRPRAARAVGQILRTAAQPGLPYHRVVAANGAIGGYGSAPEMKAALLSAEGFVIKRRRIANFADRRWPDAPGRQRRSR